MYGLAQGFIAEAEHIATARPPFIDQRYFKIVPRDQCSRNRNKIAYWYYHLVDHCILRMPPLPYDPEFCLDCGRMHFRHQAGSWCEFLDDRVTKRLKRKGPKRALRWPYNQPFPKTT